MQISKQSWHYRLLKRFIGSEKDIPQTICGYFWSVVFSVLVVGMFPALAIFVLYHAVINIPFDVYKHGLEVNSWSSNGIGSMATIITIALVVLLLTILKKIEFPQWLTKAVTGSFLVGVIGMLIVGITDLVVNLINHGFDSRQYNILLANRGEVLKIFSVASMQLTFLLLFAILSVAIIIGIGYVCKGMYKFEFIRLFLAFLKAKKDKYCIKLDFV